MKHGRAKGEETPIAESGGLGDTLDVAQPRPLIFEKVNSMGVPNRQAEFIQLVADMRAAQKEYFKFRYSSTLQRAKHLEHQVDEHLARQQCDRDPKQTPSLFGDGSTS